jgi:hypothetical protein
MGVGIGNTWHVAIGLGQKLKLDENSLIFQNIFLSCAYFTLR